MTRTATPGLVAVLLLGLAGMSACGGGEVPAVATAGNGAVTASPSGSPVRDDKKFEDCLREHGATIDKQARSGKVTGEQMEACRRYAPEGAFRPKFNAEDVGQLRVYARCIREQGVPDFPDPLPDGGFPPGGPAVKDNPKMRAALEACRDRLPQMRTGPSGKAVPGEGAQGGGVAGGGVAGGGGPGGGAK